MKILAIMGSPHAGNTLDITQRIETQLQQWGDVDFDYVHLKDVDLQPCRGCFVCFIRGEKHCPLKDDRAMIARQLDEADGVIFVSPVYSMHVSYLLKQCIDRFAYTFHRPRYFGKYALVVAATGAVGLRETLKYLKDVATAWGFEVVDQLGLVALPKHTPMRPIMQQKDRTDAVVQAFYEAITMKPPRRLTVSDYLQFWIMRAVYSRMQTMSPTDYAYWKQQGWLKPGTSYFDNHIKANVVKEWVGRIAAWGIGRQMDKAMRKEGMSRPDQ